MNTELDEHQPPPIHDSWFLIIPWRHVHRSKSIITDLLIEREHTWEQTHSLSLIHTTRETKSPTEGRASVLHNHNKHVSSVTTNDTFCLTTYEDFIFCTYHNDVFFLLSEHLIYTLLLGRKEDFKKCNKKSFWNKLPILPLQAVLSCLHRGRKSRLDLVKMIGTRGP